MEISFDGTAIVVTKTVAYAITEEFVEENEEKLKKLGNTKNRNIILNGGGWKVKKSFSIT